MALHFGVRSISQGIQTLADLEIVHGDILGRETPPAHPAHRTEQELIVPLLS
jgi:hypothetical protein